MDSLHTKRISLDAGWEAVSAWFLDTYFFSVEQEIQKGAAKNWRKVDRSQKESLKKVFENLLSQKDQACLLVAFIEDKPVGYFLGIMKDCVAEIPAKVGYINGIYVDVAWRRKGFASELYREGLTWFQSQGVFHYELYVALESEEGRRFWSSKGFLPSEQVMNLAIKS